MDSMSQILSYVLSDPSFGTSKMLVVNGQILLLDALSHPSNVSHQKYLFENEAVADDQPTQRTRRMRRRILDGASTSMAVEAERDEEIEEEELQTNYYASKSSKKKEMKKQDKEARRQAEDASRDLRHQKEDRYAEMRRRKDEEREAEELRKAEEAILQRIKEEEASNAEFEMWKDGFTVDNEGTMEEEMKQETGGLLHNFIEYIKESFEVYCDACGRSPGAVLMQEGRVIAYESRLFSKPEMTAQIYEKELLAVIYVLTQWRHYLLGADFTLFTDRQNLRYFSSQKQQSEKQMRWTNILSQFHFQIVHVQGQKNVVADALSRKPLVRAISAIQHSSSKDMVDQYATYTDYADVFTRIRDGQTVAGYSIREGYLIRKTMLCVTQPLREKVATLCRASGRTFHLVFGKEALLPIEVEIPALKMMLKFEEANHDSLKERLLYLQCLQLDRALALEHYEQVSKTSQAKANAKVKDKGIKKGDMVLRYNSKLDSTFQKKFQIKWQGLFLVLDRFPNGTYQLADLNGTLHKARVNGYRLKKYYARLMVVIEDGNWHLPILLYFGLISMKKEIPVGDVKVFGPILWARNSAVPGLNLLCEL
ncbi:hypothetical protein L7F22_045247 [Adiantum nelumboides]|nr:hypothetical protein [Adiantum nelumboides]